jgi:hypothetical protein
MIKRIERFAFIIALARAGRGADNSGEMPVSSALTALTKSNRVRRNGATRYVAG